MRGRVATRGQLHSPGRCGTERGNRRGNNRRENLRIRRIEPEDTEAIVTIQSESREASQWSAADYQDLPGRSRKGWVAEESDGEAKRLAGFIVVGHAADEMEILNLAVAGGYRRRGVARMLLAEAMREGGDAGARTIWLEVRASNESARRFYEAAGFRGAGRRVKYYRNPDEDAVRLTAQI